MVSVFDHGNYREYLKKSIEGMPKRGYGQARKLAKHVGAHTTLISQVFTGSRHFSADQAAKAAEFFGLNYLEQEYFVTLVELEKAGTPNLRSHLQERINRIKTDAGELSNRLKKDVELSLEVKGEFYSDWIYSGIRQLSSIANMNSIPAIAEYYKASPSRVSQVVDFLLRAGLCVENENGLGIGPQSTHIESTSPFVISHHRNWRQKALENISRQDDVKLHYSCPLTISKKDAAKVRELLTQVLEKIDVILDKTPSEEVRCLNIDWFKV